MTFISYFLRPPKPWQPPAPIDPLRPPTGPKVSAISIVVPVRDNQAGIDHLVHWWSRLDPDRRALELIIVDDGSRFPVRAQGPDVLLLRMRGSGPAAARNVGWRAARGAWIAFTDSDCRPDDGWPHSFSIAWDGEVGVQGRVRALESDWVSRYYEEQGVLRPLMWSNEGRPHYLITANALVYREALVRIGGFRERFELAAGEDVDLGLRLSEIGSLRWCPDASVTHDFEPSVVDFLRRFLRYGRGNRVLASVLPDGAAEAFAPRPFLPQVMSPSNVVLAALSYAALAAGWRLEGAQRKRNVPAGGKPGDR